MKYLMLLRGINVGGNNRVEMKRLKKCCEELGLQNVKTYINSGNVLFEDSQHTQAELVKKLEALIEDNFGLSIKVLLRTEKELLATAQALPETWVNNDGMKCDVMFLWEEVDSPKVMEQLPIKPELEDVRYIPGAILWRVDRKHLTKSGMLKLVGTPLYKEMTVRNCNTVRKLAVLMRELSDTQSG